MSCRRSDAKRPRSSRPPGLRRSYNRTTDDGAKFSPQPPDGVSLETGPRLEGHGSGYSVIQTPPPPVDVTGPSIPSADAVASCTPAAWPATRSQELSWPRCSGQARAPTRRDPVAGPVDAARACPARRAPARRGALAPASEAAPPPNSRHGAAPKARCRRQSNA